MGRAASLTLQYGSCGTLSGPGTKEGFCESVYIEVTLKKASQKPTKIPTNPHLV